MGIFEKIKMMKPDNQYFHHDKCTMIQLDYDQAVELGFINPELPKLGDEEFQLIDFPHKEKENKT